MAQITKEKIMFTELPPLSEERNLQREELQGKETPANAVNRLKVFVKENAVKDLDAFVKEAQKKSPESILATLSISDYSNGTKKIKEGEPRIRKGSIELLQEDSLVV